MNIQTNNNADTFEKTSPIPNAASIATAAAAAVNESNLPFYYTPSPSSSSTASSPMDYDSMMYEYQQFPSLDEFNNIIHNYLQNLSSKKRDKALVDSHRYSLILQVLKDPRNTAISTAQFRFWVKKMFRLRTTADHMEYVCHDNKPVATREDIYHILVVAHKEAHHGGRDKTSALIRKRYSWIPKELIARFVRHCPFCISRRNGCHQPTLDIVPKSPSMYTSPHCNARQRRLHRQQRSTYSKNYYNPASISMVATVATSAAAAAVAASTTWMKPLDELNENAFDFYYEQQQQRHDTLSSLDPQNAYSPKPNLFTNNNNNNTSFAYLLNNNNNSSNSTAAASAVVAAAAMAAVNYQQPSSPSSCISSSSSDSLSSISQQEQQRATSLIETPTKSSSIGNEDMSAANSPDTLLLTQSIANY